MTASNQWAFKLNSTDVGEIKYGTSGNPNTIFNLQIEIQKKIKNEDLLLTYMYGFVTKAYEKKTVIRIVAITQLIVYTHEMTIKLSLVNARKTDIASNYATKP